MEITPENIVPAKNKKINFSLFKINYALFLFTVNYKQAICKGIYFEKKKIEPKKADYITIQTSYIYTIKKNNKVRIGRITRKQILQKIS